MKTISFPADKAEDFKKMLALIIGAAPEGGALTIEEVRISLKVLDKIEKSENDIELEDADHAIVKKRVTSTKWRVASEDVVQFHDAVANAA